VSCSETPKRSWLNRWSAFVAQFSNQLKIIIKPLGIIVPSTGSSANAFARRQPFSCRDVGHLIENQGGDGVLLGGIEAIDGVEGLLKS
jgi:hypothetical protein